MKATEWYKQLPEPYRTQAFENFKAQGKEDKECDEAYHAVDMFTWIDTLEGGDYWGDFYYKIKHMKIPLVKQEEEVRENKHEMINQILINQIVIMEVLSRMTKYNAWEDELNEHIAQTNNLLNEERKMVNL